MRWRRPSFRLGGLVLAAIWLMVAGAQGMGAQQLDNAPAVARVDAAVKARIEHIAEYTVTEHYAVFRGSDESHPAAEMTVKTVYRKDHGKSYTTLTESGSSLLRSQVLGKVLENEKQMSLPGNREGALITSTNYEMKLNSGRQMLEGRECLTLNLTPRRNSPSLFKGTLWVDAQDFSIVQLEGVATKSHSMLTEPAQVMRQYARVNGFAMATHARAVSSSSLLGQTIVKIDYLGYEIKLRE